jgi:hypothetical protein
MGDRGSDHEVPGFDGNQYGGGKSVIMLDTHTVCERAPDEGETPSALETGRDALLDFLYGSLDAGVTYAIHGRMALVPHLPINMQGEVLRTCLVEIFCEDPLEMSRDLLAGFPQTPDTEQRRLQRILVDMTPTSAILRAEQVFEELTVIEHKRNVSVIPKYSVEPDDDEVCLSCTVLCNGIPIGLMTRADPVSLQNLLKDSTTWRDLPMVSLQRVEKGIEHQLQTNTLEWSDKIRVMFDKTLVDYVVDYGLDYYDTDHETTDRETTDRETTDRETTDRETTDRETTDRGVAGEKETPPPLKTTSVTGMSEGNTPSQDTPSQDTPSQDTPSQDTSSQDTSSQDTPTQDTPTQNAIPLIQNITPTENAAFPAETTPKHDQTIQQIKTLKKERVTMKHMCTGTMVVWVTTCALLGFCIRTGVFCTDAC